MEKTVSVIERSKKFQINLFFELEEIIRNLIRLGIDTKPSENIRSQISKIYNINLKNPALE
jgi:hypothetical protein